MLDLYKNIKKLRLENGWSQSELARRAGYKDRSAIAHIEDGRIDLPQSKIRLFADIFNITPAQLFGTASPSTPAASPAYSREEQDVIEAYRGLSDEGKDMVCGMLHIKRTVATKRGCRIIGSPSGMT